MIAKIIAFFKSLFTKPAALPAPIEGVVKVPEAPSAPLTKYEKLIAVAKSQLGQKEISGDQDNRQILEYFTATHYEPSPGQKLHDEVPWCAAFVNWCLREIGEKGTQSAGASSFDKWGVKLETPVPGCIAAIEHLDEHGKKNGRRHVNIYLGDDLYIGGNQGNSVCIKKYEKREVNSYRGFKS